MPDLRVFSHAPAPGSTELHLTPEESHHLIVVNRARRGDPVVAFDGRGVEWICELFGTGKHAAVLQIRSQRAANPLPYRIVLGQALPKGTTMDTIVRKATELGASTLVPLETERSQVHLEPERSGKKLEKWQVAALEAAKQCGNPFLPELRPIQSLGAFLAATADTELRLIASLHPGAQSFKAAWQSHAEKIGRAPTSLAWLIGPEGDFSPRELADALAAGFKPITFGPLVLRCDTAAVYALSISSYELQASAG